MIRRIEILRVKLNVMLWLCGKLHAINGKLFKIIDNNYEEYKKLIGII